MTAYRTPAHEDFASAVDALRARISCMTPDQVSEAVMTLIIPWSASSETASRWLSDAFLPGTGVTAEDLIHTGRTCVLLDRIQRIAHGGYA